MYIVGIYTALHLLGRRIKTIWHNFCNVLAGVYSCRYSLGAFLEHRFQLKRLSFWRLAFSPGDLLDDLAELCSFVVWEINCFTSHNRRRASQMHFGEFAVSQSACDYPEQGKSSLLLSCILC